MSYPARRVGAKDFPATELSAVRGAISDDGALRRSSWRRIADAYYKPVYAYARLRFRLSESEASDLTQAFFARCMERELLGAYDIGKGRFRTFLRVCLDRFAIDVHRASRSQAGTGKLPPVPFDLAKTDAEIAARRTQPVEDPEKCFEAEWVRRIVELSVEHLREHCATRGKEEHWRIFERYHLADMDAPPPSYEQLAEELGLSAVTIQNRLSYARRHFRRLALDILRDLTANEEELRLEARTVLGIEP
ncbi:MAG: RNA polymerase sigma factor [Sandaracinaceae bacterium]